MSAELFLVTATQDGYFGSYRKRGDVFEVTEEGFSKEWMSKGPVEKPGRDPLAELARAAREESIAAGGATAALEAALADVADAKKREAALTDRLSALEAALTAKDAVIVELKEDGAHDAPVEPVATDVPTAPVQRVRRTT